MTHPAIPTLTRIRHYLKSDMRTLRWVFLTLYVLIILGLSAPMLLAGDGEALVMWAILFGTMLLGQALFILGSGTVNLCYPIQRRRLWMPALAAAFMFTVLAAGLYLALAELTNLDRHLGDNLMWTAFFALIAISWIGWGVLIFHRASDTPRHTVLTRLTKLLFAGSLAELLAAVPSHMIVSKRPGCLVGLGTMLGITAGIYVMLFAFGPAIVLLFLRPRHRKEAMESPTCPKCFYNLTGTLAANRPECPECGAPVPQQPSAAQPQ